MLLKVAIIDSRDAYRVRLVDAFMQDYTDRLEVSSFTSLDALDDYLKDNSVDVMLVGSDLADESLVGKRGATLAYLVDDKSTELLFEQRAICRYQKVELIYKGLLDACSDRFDHITSRKTAIEGTNIIAFFPASGGAGASTMAAACALAAAKHGFRAFYLNLELYGQADLYFSAQGDGSLEDVLYAIEAKKSNVTMRLQSAVKRTQEGVCFLDSCSSALDVAELAPEMLEQLIREIASSDSYDVIVLDLDFANSPLASVAMGLATQTVFVSNGTEASNKKFERIYKALADLSREGTIDGLGNVVLAYNNFRSKSGKQLQDDFITIVGLLPHVVAGSTYELLDELSRLSVFDELLATSMV